MAARFTSGQRPPNESPSPRGPTPIATRPPAEQKKQLLVVVAGCLLFVIAWPLAIALVFLLPLLWLLDPVPDLRRAARGSARVHQGAAVPAGAVARPSRLKIVRLITVSNTGTL